MKSILVTVTLALETLAQGATHNSRSLTEVMHGLDIGQVGGPVKIKEGYSIFKILERRQEKSPYNEESQRRSNAYVKVDKAKRGYVKYVRSLREKYPVDINEDSLQKIGTQSSS